MSEAELRQNQLLNPLLNQQREQEAARALVDLAANPSDTTETQIPTHELRLVDTTPSLVDHAPRLVEKTDVQLERPEVAIAQSRQNVVDFSAAIADKLRRARGGESSQEGIRYAA